MPYDSFTIDGQTISKFMENVYTDGTNFYALGPFVKTQPKNGGLEGTLQETKALIKLDPGFVREFKLDEAWAIALHFAQQEKPEPATNP